MKTPITHPITLVPATINIHLTRLCNFGCRYCYAEFRETGAVHIRRTEMFAILDAIAENHRVGTQPRKVNFAGGEPFLYRNLPDLIDHAKKLALTTSVVTNGSLLTGELVSRLDGCLDILTLSVDSMKPDTNRQIGRHGRGTPLGFDDYLELAELVHGAGIRRKVNTVVNRLNLNENIGAQITALSAFRWKILQAKRILGQNDLQFEQMAVSTAEFHEYVARNRRQAQSDMVIVPETADDMTDSYAMIAPNGCFFDNSRGVYRYSRPILEVGIVEAFQDVEFDADKFVKRGGVYE
ncbi:MAG: viperin family antiviral radical SAM protein [Verrucomicrobia subdivision 3 bacterium]|nr:viperin family antiviral radical SAM protein [Limisphaerales bacterium]